MGMAFVQCKYSTIATKLLNLKRMLIIFAFAILVHSTLIANNHIEYQYHLIDTSSFDKMDYKERIFLEKVLVLTSRKKVKRALHLVENFSFLLILMLNLKEGFLLSLALDFLEMLKEVFL